MYSILFVCTANICRSPMAMALFQARVAREPGEWRIDSAGVWAQAGNATAENTQLILLERGLNLGGYRSKPVTRDLLEQFNLILTMERGQRDALRAAFPHLAGRVFVVTEMTGRAIDIVDPIGGPLIEFEDTARELTQIYDRGFERIRSLARGAVLA
jgi:protein-tyrosine-phosphatase